MNAETANLLEESERLLRGEFYDEEEVMSPPTSTANEEDAVVVKKKRKKKKKKSHSPPKFGKRMMRNSQIEIESESKDVQKKETAPKVGGPSLSSTFNEKSLLADREWENELARSILTLYQANSGEAKEEEFFPPINKRETAPVASPSKPKKASVSLKQPSHIWFAGTGIVKAVWCSLTDDVACQDSLTSYDTNKCSHALCVQLRELEQKAKYEKYIDIVAELLMAFSRQNTFDRAEKKQEERMEKTRKLMGAPVQVNAHTCDLGYDSDPKEQKVLSSFDKLELEDKEEDYMLKYETLDPTLLTEDRSNVVERMMWRQLVVCCNIFGVKLTEQTKYNGALKLFKRAEGFLESTSATEGGSAFVGKIKQQLSGFVWDSLGHYYYKRKKPNAAALYAQKAMRVHVKLEQWDHVAKCHLHCGAILSMMSKHEESVKCMAQILEMVEDERLQVGGTNAQKICMVAVCYHNIAVEQLLLRRPAEACVSSQNGRRLARLSLSYANRWLTKFEGTHQFALKEMSSQHAFLNDKGPRKKEMVRDSLKSKKTKRMYSNIVKSVNDHAL